VPNFSSQGGIDQFNEQLRAMPEYQEFLRSLGADPSGALRLTDSQRKQAERWVQTRYGNIGNLEIDPAGNVNQDEGFSRHAKWMIPAAIGAATLGVGAAGAGPLAGLFGGGGGTLASSSLPTASLMGGPAAASAGLSGAGLASSALPAAGLMGGPAAASAGLSGAGAAGGIGSRIASVSGSGAGEVAGGGESILRDILKWVPTGLAGVNAVRSLTQGAPPAQANLERLLQMAEGRVNQTQPLFDALNAMAQAQMPRYSRGGE
jgi:hypothetical protein